MKSNADDHQQPPTSIGHQASAMVMLQATKAKGRIPRTCVKIHPPRLPPRLSKRRRWCWSGKSRNDSSSTYTRNKSTRWLLIASARQKHSLTSPRRRIKSNRTLSSFRIPSEVLQIRQPKRVVLWGGAKKQRPIQSCE